MSSSSWQLRALIKKNLLILKRNLISTLCEILFPIILILLSLAIRSAFTLEKYEFDKEEGSIENYIRNKSMANYELSYDETSPLYGISMSNSELSFKTDTISLTWLGMSIMPIFRICSKLNTNFKEREIIATIGIPDKIKEQMIQDSKLVLPPFNYTLSTKNFKNFSTIDELNDYIRDPGYGKEEQKPLICFGMSMWQEDGKYNYSLHYFDSQLGEGVKDINNVKNGLYDRFQSGPNLDSFLLYRKSGYTYIMKLINEYILQKETGQDDAKLNFGVLAMKYIDYRKDPFSSFVGYMIPFFIVIAYMCPLCLYVYRMVGEKENKSKEGMKIMGLTEGTYFLSYFLQYLVITLIDTIINSIVMTKMFTKIPWFIMFLVLFFWALDVFALAFFFQSFIDKTRVALILSLLIYYVMYFLSMACMGESASKVLKIIMSILPPVCVELGIVLFGKFESHFRQFHSHDYFKLYTNYSVGVMNIMQIVDFFLFLFIGYYLQNILPHDFGIKRPWYFICTSEYWCGKDSRNKKKNEKVEEELNKIEEEVGGYKKIRQDTSQTKKIKELDDPKPKSKKKKKKDPNFEGEELYKDRTKPDDAVRIKGIVKEFDDGKVAVNHVDLNFYKDEIFALLGHNGAGKTTLISMLTGLYEATEGSAYFDGYDILESNNMDKFRRKLGICPQHDVLFDDLTIKEHLEMFAIFKGYNGDNLEGEVAKVTHDFELDNIQNITAKNLSAGQRRKLSIAISLIGGSQVIFLDEPSSGMDITSRRNLWEILKRQTEQKIIILTTHYMEEASVLGNRIGIISEGKMKCIGTPLFLIERFGKYLSLNITKEEDAKNDEIVNFIMKKATDIQCEILSEEIMFRIPKSTFSQKNIIPKEGKLILNENGGELKNKTRQNKSEESIELISFFEDLDKNLKGLKIKTYSASMPTLEDVFLNVAVEDNMKTGQLHRKFSLTNEANDLLLFETDIKEDYSKKSKFINDFKCCFHRRLLLTLRDVKGFLMEILCPILLCLVGLGVSQVDIMKASKPQTMSMSFIGKQKILYSGINGINDLENYYFNNMANITCETLDIGPISDKEIAVKSFFEKVYDITKDYEDSYDHEVDMMDKDYIGYYGSLLILKDDNNKFEFIELLNSRVSHGVSIYSYFFLKKIIEKAAGKEINIDFVLYPLPLTAELEEKRDQANNTLVVFFVAIAFALIPANFITIIVKEKVNNSKHLMRVSGINVSAYWIVNYIFELLKYYFTCGICLLLLWAFSFYKDYLYILYLLYGPPTVSITYILSFLFASESTAQNGVILLNFLLGALGGVVILILRALDNVKMIAKVLEYILLLLPSFAYNFGFDLLLNKFMLYQADYPNEFYFFKDKVLIEKFNLLLAPIVYLGLETVVYTIILVIIEYFSYSYRSVYDSLLPCSVNDSQVLKEIEKANQENPQIRVLDKQGKSNKIEYAVRIKNLQKIYHTKVCSGNRIEAIKNLNFCVEPGECFGLLGLNGAGKTTTFKCITQEESPSNGKIYINGVDMSNSFSKLSSLFGYCPQFDAIFEYLSVYENLSFYASIKGIKEEYLDKVVKAMIEEMSLSEFTTKISGKLSGGNKRKLSVAISFLCNPPIVLLDEPSTGMDPEARRFMWSVIHKISSKGKRSSVIMTTHSMDEAETLCKRMAIMVNGEFECLGKAGQIKEKYGYGYEIDVRIKPLPEEMFLEILTQVNLDKSLKVNKDNIEEILKTLKKENYIKELTKGRLGSKIIRDIELNQNISLYNLVSWVFFIRKALTFIRKSHKYFEEIILSEHIDNNFLFKMKKGKNSKSIGFFFGLFESSKDKCMVTEYSIQQTSLEQIFNKFAEKQAKAKNENGEEIKDNENKVKKEEIPINELLYKLLVK